MTAEAFAEALGVNPVTVRNWERGAKTPEWPSIQAIMAAYPGSPPPPGSPSDQALEGSVSDPAGKVDPSNPLEAYLVLRADDLSPAEVRHLRELAPRQLSGVVPDVAYYDGMLNLLREFKRRAAARTG